MVGEDVSNVLRALTVWSLRDLLMGYLIALPILLFFRRLGVKSLLGFWGIGAAIGAPFGFILANP